MWRDDRELIIHPKVGFLLSHGALGDTVTSLPAIRYARQSHHPAMEMLVWTRADLVPLVELLLPKQNLAVMPIEHFHALRQEHGLQLPFPYAMNSSINNTITRNKIDMVLFAFHSLLDCDPPSMAAMDYPTAPLGPRPEGMPARYAVISPNGTSPSRIFPAKLVEGLIRHLLSRGITPVFLGQSQSSIPVMIVNSADGTNGTAPKVAKATSKLGEVDPALMAQCVDLRDKTPILKARDIIGHADLMIGIDGGLLHVAGTTDVPIIYALTTVEPRHRWIIRKGQQNRNLKFVTPRDLKCAGCQSNWTLVFGHPFSTCIYSDVACVDHLALADFTEAIDSLTTAPKG